MDYKELYMQYKAQLNAIERRIGYVIALRRSLWDQKESIEFQCANFRVYALYKEKKELMDKSMEIMDKMSNCEFCQVFRG